MAKASLEHTLGGASSDGSGDGAGRVALLECGDECQEGSVRDPESAMPTLAGTDTPATVAGVWV